MKPMYRVLVLLVVVIALIVAAYAAAAERVATGTLVESVYGGTVVTSGTLTDMQYTPGKVSVWFSTGAMYRITRISAIQYTASRLSVHFTGDGIFRSAFDEVTAGCYPTCRY